jgi:hypothetical protein
MLETVRTRVLADQAVRNPRAELRAYLDLPLEQDVIDIIRWWGVCHFAFYFGPI